MEETSNLATYAAYTPLLASSILIGRYYIPWSYNNPKASFVTTSTTFFSASLANYYYTLWLESKEEQERKDNELLDKQLSSHPLLKDNNEKKEKILNILKDTEPIKKEVSDKNTIKYIEIQKVQVDKPVNNRLTSPIIRDIIVISAGLVLLYGVFNK